MSWKAIAIRSLIMMALAIPGFVFMFNGKTITQSVFGVSLVVASAIFSVAFDHVYKKKKGAKK